MLVISIKAGGRGLNLPAANHVIHFDRWWNPAVEQQATDRVHRVGQRKPVFVHSLICVGTLEERIDQLLESKRELAAKVIHAGSEDWLGDSRPRRDPRRRRALAGLDGGGGMSERTRGTGRGRGSSRRAVVRDEGSAVAERAARSCAREPFGRSRSSREGSRAERGRCAVAITARPVPPRIWAAMCAPREATRRSKKQSRAARSRCTSST